LTIRGLDSRRRDERSSACAKEADSAYPMALGLLTAASGMALLVLSTGSSGYPTLLPALLLWGIGLGLLTPAVVAAAIGSVDAGRAGLASAVNNTARQAGGAIGIAAFGSLAGAPASHGFLTGFHTAGIVGAGLFLAGAAATVAFIPITASQGSSDSPLRS
jgi:MFS transporter, DHA2 family, methylenomycin A resistance protein